MDDSIRPIGTRGIADPRGPVQPWQPRSGAGRAKPWGESLRRIRPSSVTKIIQADELIRFYWMMKDCPDAANLAKKMLMCVAGRREDSTSGAAGDWRRSKFPRCRRPACPACYDALVRKRKARAKKLFGTAENDDMSLVTIRLARTSDLTRIRDVALAIRVKLRQNRETAAGKWEAWRRVRMFGYVEVGAMRESDIEFLPPKVRQSILAAPVDGHSDTDPVWLPHLHVMIWHEGIGSEELAGVLAEDFPDVHVRPFHHDRTVDENVGAVVQYALKRTARVEFDGGLQEEWPLAWEAQFYLWLHDLGRALQPLEVRLGPMKSAGTVHPRMPRLKPGSLRLQGKVAKLGRWSIRL